MLYSNSKQNLLDHHISKVLTIYKKVLRELLFIEIKIYELDKKSDYVKQVISNENNNYYYDEDNIEFKYVVLCLNNNKKLLKLTKDNSDNTNLISNFFKNSLRLRNRLWHPEFDKINEVEIYCKIVKLMLCIFNFIESSYKDYKIIKKEYYQFLQLFLNEFDIVNYEKDNFNIIKKEIKYSNLLNEISKYDFSQFSYEDDDDYSELEKK